MEKKQPAVSRRDHHCTTNQLQAQLHRGPPQWGGGAPWARLSGGGGTVGTPQWGDATATHDK